jgi:hypothetical protein
MSLTTAFQVPFLGIPFDFLEFARLAEWRIFVRRSNHLKRGGLVTAVGELQEEVL